MKEIVLFASGSGSNVENIATYFKDSPTIAISCVLTNKNDAFVLERCKKLHLPSLCFNTYAFKTSNVVLDTLRALDPDLIVLAGFLLKVPQKIISAFPDKIINIHPALLPKYGGKGMYGMHVHEAVRKNNERISGITIHYVNENYDEGGIIFQAETPLLNEDSAAAIADKVHQLEYEHFPRVIEQLLDQHG